MGMMERVVDMKSPAEVLGAKLLNDIHKEEGSLESLLRDLRKTQPTQTSKTGILELDGLWKHHGVPRLSIFGHGLALLYKLIHHQVRTLSGTVALIDVSGTFSPSHLQLSRQELNYVHIFRPHRGNLRITLDSLEEYMLWGEGSVGSRNKEWVSTLVNGGGGGDVNVGWRGWLRVEREALDRTAFGAGTSVEEAVVERKRRADGLVGGENEAVAWKAVSEYGEFSWHRL